jgi:proteasome lid subunit RPN8/RPN11
MIFLLHQTRYPYEAPQVLADRKSFPRTLPHLYPVSKGLPVSLCLHRGNIHEWFAEHTILDFVDRTRAWLADAAVNNLIKEKDRFEATRIDEARGFITFSYKLFSDIADGLDAPSHRYMPFLLHQSTGFEKADKPYPPFLIHQKNLRPRDVEQKSSGVMGNNKMSLKHGSVFITNFGLLTWPEAGKVNTEYFGELPTTFGELLDFSSRVGCPLKVALQGLLEWMAKGKFSPDWIPVVLAIRRPHTLIAQETNIELLAFLIDNRLKGTAREPVLLTAPVQALAHLEPLTRERARTLSRHEADPPLGRIALLGGGALGSKIALHLGRGGHDALTIIDNDLVLHHNLVRHALLTEALWQNKAQAISNALDALFRVEEKLDVQYSSHNVLDVLFWGASNILDNHNLILNCTASNPVFSALSTATLPANTKIIHFEIADEGKLGLQLYEGPNRSPRVDDLQALLWTKAAENEHVKHWLENFRKQRLQADDAMLEEIRLGVSCGSSTLRLGDDVVSYHAATMALALRAKPTGGEISLTWYDLPSSQPFGSLRYPVGPTTVIRPRNSSDWEVRLLDPATTFIRATFARDLPNETGGILFGHIDPKKKILYVTKAMGPPPDSEQQPYLFKKGSVGISDAVTNMMTCSGELITYVGEWHSHPDGGLDLSAVDKVARDELRAELDKLNMPTHILIVTPNELASHVFSKEMP